MTMRAPTEPPGPDLPDPDKLTERDRDDLAFAAAHGCERLPTSEDLARYDAWVASEDPDFMKALDELDRRPERVQRRR